MRVLTWNIYRGTIPYYTINGQAAATPDERLNIIMDIAVQNNVDVVVLQELPFGFVVNPPHGWNAATIEEHPSMQYACSSFNTTYAFIWNAATVQSYGNIQYFNPETFVLPTGCLLRAPVFIEVTHNQTNYQLFNWHNETGNWGDSGLEILSQQQFYANTVIGADFNANYQHVDWYFNNQWVDVTGVNGTIDGVDHILTNVLQTNPVLGNELDFTSDAYHWPVAADIA